MKPLQIVGLVLLVLGVLGVAYEQFTYTTDKHEASVGPVDLTVKEEKTVDIPKWAGIAAIVIGGGLLLVGSRRRD